MHNVYPEPGKLLTHGQVVSEPPVNESGVVKEAV